MLGIHDYSLFISTAVLLNLTHGPDTMYIIGRSLTQGRSSGVASALGISTGSICHTVAAALGLSAILATSAMAFSVIKYLGAAYLFYLGIKMLLSKHQNEASALAKVSPWGVYRQGVITNVLNPKVALFFLALLPQFVNKDAPAPTLSFLALGMTFVMTGTLWCLVVALSAARFSSRLRANSGIFSTINRLTGGLFIGLSLKLATAERT